MGTEGFKGKFMFTYFDTDSQAMVANPGHMRVMSQHKMADS